nr:CoB--CoM heterodisulfide reductase subunit C [Candidatus Sigynarchaeota archaeon]
MSIKRETIKKIDHKLVEEVVEDELLERFKSCYQCGTCSGGCPSGRRTAMRTRELIRQGLAGLTDELLSSDLLWLCSTCYTCAERCPRDVPSTDIILKLRNIAAHRGLMRGPHVAVCKNLFNTGHGVPIGGEPWLTFRKTLKLSPLPPTVHSFPEALKEVQTIVKETGFEQLITQGEAVQKEMIKKEQEMTPQKIKALEDQLQKLKADAEKAKKAQEAPKK